MYLKVMQDVQQPYCQTLCLSETCTHRATKLQVVRAITWNTWNSFSFLLFTVICNGA